MFNDKAVKSTDILHLDIYSLDVKNIYNRYFFLLNNFKILYRFWQCVGLLRFMDCYFKVQSLSKN